MSISDKTKKLLWARSGNRCALCSNLLTKTLPSGTHVILGDEAHIHARNQGGPRWNQALAPHEIDSYDNLILLCTYHHRKVDQAPADWPAPNLVERKRIHEQWVEETLGQVEAAPLGSHSVKLTLCNSGRELWQHLIGVDSWAFDFELVTVPKADQVCARLQDLFHNNWDLLSPEEFSGEMRLEGQAALQAIIDQLRENGYVIYAGRSQTRSRIHGGGPSCLVSVQPLSAAVNWTALPALWEKISHDAKSGEDVALRSLLEAIRSPLAEQTQVVTPFILQCLSELADSRLSVIVSSLEIETRASLRTLTEQLPDFQSSKPWTAQALGLTIKTEQPANLGPKQNRVNPFGEIVARPEKGLFTGNRGGALHDDQQRIVRHYTNKRWIICELEFNDRKAQIMAPGLYTHLFFLDEATALAAGHRPCFECRRTRAKEFYQAWLLSLEPGARSLANLDALDARLHEERIQTAPRRRWGRQKLVQLPISNLPNGAFIELGRLPHLTWDKLAYIWTGTGYGQPVPLAENGEVTVLTPPSTLAALAHGYVPCLHPTFNQHPESRTRR